jgi:hypothetical protein
METLRLSESHDSYYVLIFRYSLSSNTNNPKLHPWRNYEQIRFEGLLATTANHTNEPGWEILAQRRVIARLCVLYKAYTGRRAWKAIGDSVLKPCYPSRDDHGRKQRTGVGKCSFVNRTLKDWNRLPAGVLAAFHCKSNTFRKRVREAVTSKQVLSGDWMEISEVTWSNLV